MDVARMKNDVKLVLCRKYYYGKEADLSGNALTLQFIHFDCWLN